MDTEEGSGEQDEEAPFHMLLEAEFSTISPHKYSLHVQLLQITK